MHPITVALVPILTALFAAPRTEGGAPAPAPQDPPALPDLPGEAAPPVLIAADGEPVAPGRVPAGTSPEALRRWNRMLAKLASASEGPRPPITDFDLSVDVVHRREGGSNESEAGFRYLETPRGPYLRVYLERKDLVVLRGPSGDWLLDGDEVKDLRGRDGADDRRLLDEYTSLCRNFLSLTRPDQVRLVRLEAREVSPEPVAAGSLTLAFRDDAGELRFPDARTAEEARGLEWLYVESPDFRLVQTRAGAPAIPRALLGLERKTGEVRLAVLANAAGPLIAPESVLVLLGRYRDLEGGWRVPRSLRVKPVDATTRPPGFARLEETEVWLKNASRLNTGLDARAFLPR